MERNGHRRAGSNSAARDLVIGAVAGVAATVAMTVAAERLFRRLPAEERYPLPLRELTERAAEEAGIADELDEPALQAATLASHFGFGAATGALYVPLLLHRRLPPVVSGCGYAVGVWALSYLGWVPAFALLRPATAHPSRRNALMLTVHLVWGSALGLVADRLSRSLPTIAGGPLRDR